MAIAKRSSLEDFAIMGKELESLARPALDLRPREQSGRLREFLGDSHDDSVCIISGLQRTGKTTLILQAIAGMDAERKEKCAYIDAGACGSAVEMERLLRGLQDVGIKAAFIDEVTRIPDFTDRARLYHSRFAKSGMKIVLTGTDSLRFHLVINDDLHGKSTVIETTRIPFAEYERLTGVNHIDQYMAFGGVLFNPNSRIAKRILAADSHIDLPTILAHAGRNYLDVAIARNLQHAFRQDKNRLFGSLTRIANEKFFIQSVYRLVLKDTKEYLLETLMEDFINGDLEQASRNISRIGNDFNIGKEDISTISKIYADRLDIIEKPKAGIADSVFLNELRHFFRELDFAIHYNELDESGGSREKIVFTQPALRWHLLMELIELLESDDGFNRNYSAEQRDLIVRNIFHSVQGKLLEDIIIMKTMEKLPRHMSLCKFRGAGMKSEYDMVIRDSKKGVADFFEIKHSARRKAGHERHLQDRKLLDAACRRLGAKAGKRVILHDGDFIRQENGIIRMNFHDWLRNNLQDSLARLGKAEAPAAGARKGLKPA